MCSWGVSLSPSEKRQEGRRSNELVFPYPNKKQPTFPPRERGIEIEEEGESVIKAVAEEGEGLARLSAYPDIKNIENAVFLLKEFHYYLWNFLPSN